MKTERRRGAGEGKPKLAEGMSVDDFVDYYWFKDDLIKFAKKLGLDTRGYKPELSARIERRLRGKPDRRASQSQNPGGPRGLRQTVDS